MHPNAKFIAASNKKSQRITRIRPKLEAFSSLPDEALVEIGVVSALLDRCPASIWRDVKNGRIDRPIKVGQSSRFRVGNIRAIMRGARP